MTDGDNPASYLCSLEGLLQQARGLLINNASLACCFVGTTLDWHDMECFKERVHLIGRNTNEGFDRIWLAVETECFITPTCRKNNWNCNLGTTGLIALSNTG